MSTLPSSESNLPPASSDVVREFVEHWGGMARSWGINATMGELFALLYITGTIGPLTTYVSIFMSHAGT